MMRKISILFCFVLLTGCGDCTDTAGDELGDNNVDTSRFGDMNGVIDTEVDMDGADGSFELDMGMSNNANNANNNTNNANNTNNSNNQNNQTNNMADMGQDQAATPVCGDSNIEGNEVCDDGNTSDGDYCSADCSTETGMCGDGIVQSNETCDDASTTNCFTTHDGGDGTCVQSGQCVAGYNLDANGNCVSSLPPGIPTPCSLGTGGSLFKFHYDSGSTSARIDNWHASCSYSFAPNSACNVREVYPGFGDVERTSQGYPVATSSHYVRVRYSVSGLSFTNATLYVQARSYSTGASTNIRAWSPIYGDVAYGPVDNDFTYDWYAIDWSNFLSPSDQPSLTAIQLYAYQGSNSLAIKAVELCVE